MRVFFISIIFTMIFSVGFSQNNSFYKVGDTLYYQNNRATRIKTATFVIIKETNVAQNSNNFKVQKYIRGAAPNKFILESEFITNGLQQLKANGLYTSFHSNGKIASKGETINGKLGDGIWTYYYENGKIKSEQRLSKETFFNVTKENLIINFWNQKGVQTVKDGNGEIEETINKINIKGTYKKGVKDGLWVGSKNERKIYEETYKKGTLVKGTSWNEKGDSFNYKKIITNAYYKKTGNSSVRKYISKNFNSNTAGIKGDLFVTFNVTTDGKLSNIAIIKGISVDYNSEIKRILSNMQGWTPAKDRGQNIVSKYILDLRFKD